MSAEDVRLEIEIDQAYEAVLEATTDTELTAAWQHMRELVSQRTPQRVQQMERERGLSA